MEYNVIKNADKILSDCPYFINNPYKYKNKWHDLFNNHNKIYLELGTGRGDFIINMAKQYPNINFIAVELNSSQLATASLKLQKEKLSNLKLINDDARNITKIFGKEMKPDSYDLKRKINSSIATLVLNYEDVENAIASLAYNCNADEVKYLAMPRIASGRAFKLDWSRVREIIIKTLNEHLDHDMVLTFCYNLKEMNLFCSPKEISELEDTNNEFPF